MKPVVLRDGTRVTLRDIRPEDEAALTALYERLSPQTAYQRFFTVMRRLPPNWGHILANVDYDRRMAIVALDPDGQMIGVARYVYDDRAHEAELAIVIEDPWQGRGLGQLLLGELVAYAVKKGVGRFRAYVLADNVRMLKLLRRYRGRESSDTVLSPRPLHHGACFRVRLSGGRASYAEPGTLSSAGKLSTNVAPWPGTD